MADARDLLAESVRATGDAAADATATLADAVGRLGWGVATAESLTGGTIGSLLAAAPAAGTWFRGGVVAYSAEVKYAVLDVPRGPVVTQVAAAAMARSTARLLGADLCVAVTGVGGPEPEEGEPPGTVWFGVTSPSGTTTERAVFDGGPVEVLAATTLHALALLQRAADDAGR